MRAEDVDHAKAEQVSQQHGYEEVRASYILPPRRCRERRENLKLKIHSISYFYSTSYDYKNKGEENQKNITTNNQYNSSQKAKKEKG